MQWCIKISANIPHCLILKVAINESVLNNNKASESQLNNFRQNRLNLSVRISQIGNYKYNYKLFKIIY